MINQLHVEELTWSTVTKQLYWSGIIKQPEKINFARASSHKEVFPTTNDLLTSH